VISSSVKKHNNLSLSVLDPSSLNLVPGPGKILKLILANFPVGKEIVIYTV
jgi:hypothetical protein